MSTISPFSFRVFEYNGKLYTSLISCISSLSINEKIEEPTPLCCFQRVLSYPERKPVDLEPVVKAWIESSPLIKKKLTETLDFPIVCPFPQLTSVIENLRKQYRGKVFDIIIKDEEIEISDEEIIEILEILNKIRIKDGQTKYYYFMIFDLIFSITSGNEDEVEKFKQIMKQWEGKTSLERFPKMKKTIIQISNQIHQEKVDSISKVSISICEYIRAYVIGKEKINYKTLKIRFAPDHRDYRKEYIAQLEENEKEEEEEPEPAKEEESVKEEEKEEAKEKIVEVPKEVKTEIVEVVKEDEKKEEPPVETVEKKDDEGPEELEIEIEN